MTSDGHLHLVGLDLLAEVFRRAAHHQPGDEHRDDREDQHAVESGADAADRPPRRAASATSAPARRAACSESCIELTEPLEAAVVAVAHSAELAIPKRTSLPSMLPPACSSLATWSTPSGGERGLPACSADRSGAEQGDEDDGHGGQHGPALPGVADHLAEGVAERRRDQQDREHLDEVRQRRRVLERMRRVDVEEAAAVRAELLDRDLRGGRAHGEQLLVTGFPSASVVGCSSAPADRRRRFWTTPCDTRTSASTIDSGSRM